MNSLLKKLENLKTTNYKDRLIIYRQIEKEFPDKLTEHIHKDIINTAYNATFRAFYVFHNTFDAIINAKYCLYHLKFIKNTTDLSYLPKFYKVLADIFISLNEPKKALHYIKKSLSLISNDIRYKHKVLLVKAKILTDQNQWKESEKLYTKCFHFFQTKNDLDLAFHPILNYYFFEVHNLEKAKFYLTKLEKNNPDYYLYNGYYSYFKQNYQTAEENFNQFLLLNGTENLKPFFLFYYIKTLIKRENPEWKKYVQIFITKLREIQLNYRDIKTYSKVFKKNIQLYESLFLDIIHFDIQLAHKILILVKNHYDLVEKEIDGFRYILLDKENQFLDYKFKKITFSAEENQNSILAKNHLILDYYYNQSHLYIYKLTKDTIQIKKHSITSKKLETLISALHSKTTHILNSTISINSKRPNDAIAKTITKMRFLLIPELIDTKNIFFIPYKKLHKINLNNLLVSSHKKTIYISNSSKLITPPKETKKIKILFILNPDLLFSRKEVQIATKYFETKSVSSFNDIKKNISNFPIIHFATHFQFNKDNFYNSYIDTGKEKIYYHQLEQLVVEEKKIILDACETGRKKKLEIEEHLDLSKIFLINKASEIFVSLYEITDGLSFSFFKIFYSHLAKNHNFSQSLNLILSHHSNFALINPFYIRV